MSRENRERGVTLRTLDLSGLAEQALAKYNESRTEAKQEPATAMRATWAPYALLARGERMWVINVEGVGYEVTDHDPLEIEFYPSWGDSFGIMPAMQATFDRDEVRARATGDEIDLADLIRTFGARLEQNFWTWHRIATEAVPA